MLISVAIAVSLHIRLGSFKHEQYFVSEAKNVSDSVQHE